MRNFIFIIVLTSIFSSFCWGKSGYVIEIDSGTLPSEDHLVFINNEDTLFVSAQDNKSLRYYKNAYQNKKKVTYILDKSFTPSPTDPPPEPSPIPQNTQMAFDLMNINWKSHSQCFDRAHVWVYEAYRKKIEMGKAFLFFTKRYIRSQRFMWWFHVSPTIKSSDQLFVMDRRFTKKPLPLKEWSDYFVFTQKECPIIQHYSTYVKNRDQQDCYLIMTSKYIKHPSQIRRKIKRTRFVKEEVNSSYRRGFKKRKS